MIASVHEKYEILILGTDPGGLQAAIHSARAKASVLVMVPVDYTVEDKQRET